MTTTPNRRRRETSNEEYRAMLERMLRAYVRRITAGAGDLEMLAALDQLREHLTGHLADAVAELRAEPNAYSWQELADALGKDRQNTARRWGRKTTGARQPGGQPGHRR